MDAIELDAKSAALKAVLDAKPAAAAQSMTAPGGPSPWC